MPEVDLNRLVKGRAQRAGQFFGAMLARWRAADEIGASAETAA